MIPVTETFRMALRALRRNTLRSILTALGIIIGVAAVVAMVSIGEGAKGRIRSQIEGAGTNVILVFSGSSNSGGMRGGMGMRLKYSNPMYLDDVAVDFPDMPIVLAHPSFPWTEEGLGVCQHKPNVYYDMSGWSPKYFPEIFIKYANSILKKKMLFGSDWPAITPDRWLADFENAPFKDEVRPLILKENALRILGETVE